MQGSELAGLINRVALGDRQAFATLYGQTSPKLFSVCMRILRNGADAEEALQEVYIKIWQRAKSFALASGQPMTWLCSIARNHAIDVIRARKPVSEDISERDDIADDVSLNPEQSLATTDDGRRIDRCMEELVPEHARAVRRAYVEGLTYQEVANDLGAPLNTVRTWLRRSLLKLRECIER